MTEDVLVRFKEGYDQLAIRHLTDESYNALSESDKNAILETIRINDSTYFMKEISRLPKALRFKFIKLAALPSIEERFLGEDYSLRLLLLLIGDENHIPLFSWLGKDRLQKIIQDKFQLAEVVSLLSPAVMPEFIALIDITYVQQTISSSYELRMMLNKLSLDEWEKLHGLAEYLPQAFNDLFLNDLEKLPRKMHADINVTPQWKFIELIGLNKAAALIQNPAQFSNVVSTLTIDQQKLFIERVDFKKVFLNGKAKNKSDLKVNVNSAMAFAEKYREHPHIHDKILKQTLDFYANGRNKLSCLGFFSKKTKAANSLNRLVKNKLDSTTLNAYENQFKQTNELGNLYLKLRPVL